MDSDTCVLMVKSLSYGGRGVCRREDNKVVFVHGVMPGEQVRARITKEHKTYAEAEPVEIIEPSPERRAPACPYFGVCGGCDWQHIPYQMQVEWKQKILLDEIKRNNPLPGDVYPLVESADEYGYRGQARMQRAYARDLVLGFFEKGSNKIIDIPKCPILNPGTGKTFERIREMLERYNIPRLYSIEILSPGNDTALRMKLRGRAAKTDLDAMDAIYKQMDIQGLMGVSSGPEPITHVFGTPSCSYEMQIGDRMLEFISPPGGFMQSNMYINRIMAGHLMDMAGDSKRILELYSGAGNFTLPLSLNAREVSAIERNKGLNKMGRLNAKRNRIANIRFMRMESKTAVQMVCDESIHFDTIVLDPPRIGAAEISGRLPKTDASRIIYISCNPSTLSRDLATLRKGGFTIKNTRFFDMFPQTYHIESITCLER